MHGVVLQRQWRLLVSGVALLALLLAAVQPARTAQAAGLPAGWGSETPVAPLRGSLGPGPQLHVAPDGTIRYLAATDPSGYKGKHRIWQRSADGKVQAFGLPKGMVQTVDFAYTVKQTYLGKPDKSGGYLVVQYNGDTKDRKLRAAYVPHGVDPSTVSASVQASGEGKSPRLFLSSPSGAAALVVPNGTGFEVLLRPAGAGKSFGAPTVLTGWSGMALDDIVGGFIDPDGGVLVVSQLHDFGSYNPRTIGQTYINASGSVGASEALQRQEQEFQLVDTGASDNGNGILVWDRYDASDAFTRHTWVSTRRPGQLLSAPAAFGGVTRSGSAPSAAIADDGSAAVFYSDGTSCVDGKAAGKAPWVATRAAGGSKWVTTSRGAAVRSQLAVPASGGNRIVALYYDALDPCGAWPVPVSYKLGLSGQSQSLTSPQEVAVGASNDHITVASAVNASGVAAALVHATKGDTAVSASTLITVNAPGSSPKKLTTATPKIAGTAKVGKKLTVTAGAWTGGTKLTYQWYASGTAIAKATAASFTVQPAQAGKTITVKVTGSKSGYTTASKTSKATAKVAKGTLKTATPKITGTAKVGKKLKAVTGTWTGGTKLTYQWYAAGTAIKKATKSTLTLTSKQAGKKITVKVTGKKSGYTTVTKTSKVTAKVKK